MDLLSKLSALIELSEESRIVSCILGTRRLGTSIAEQQMKRCDWMLITSFTGE